ncbi:WD repeat-containing protein 46 [Thamnophis elegans]|uniref:WD repeat-containing protein 46 n=1 Tax=Thamnophis elegans TaxID=35005 RepID=UPI0013767B4C|nr:WD repeat-containing protein 46 [Thamnophis elegans]
MAAAGEAGSRGEAAPAARKKAGRPQRYWDGEPGGAGGDGAAAPPKTKRARRPRRTQKAGKRRISGKEDPFPGAPDPVGPERARKFQRGAPQQLEEVSSERLKHRLASQEEKARAAARQAARMELLLLEEPGFLEGEEEEDTCTVSQAEIAAAVDLAASAKHFELRLDRFGPYRLSYTRNGRHLLLGGRRGHVAALDWQTKALMCEINVMETITDLTWLHTETLFAVAQRKWLYVYDQQGVELNCLKCFNGVQRMEFLPYHFLLATASESGFLQYLDISVGKEVATICTKAGRLAVMAQNPSNAIVHLGHSNGTVTLWSPSAKAPLARMLCHQGAVRAVAIDPSGSYMATSGLDHKLHIYDLRAYRRLHSLLLPCGAGLLDFSQRGLLGAACQDVVQVYKDVSVGPPQKPYLCHRLPSPSHGLRFCPFEDVLGVGHEQGFASLLVPGAGEPNFDALENNPFRSRRQRQEWEVKAFLEKIPSELISLDPTELGRVDPISSEQQRKERAERLGYDPEAKEPFSPRRKLKGRDSAGSRLKRRKKVAAEEQRALVRKSLAAKAEAQPAVPKTKLPAAHSSALDRFRK